MPLPLNVGTGTLGGTLIDTDDGTPLQGTATFMPSVRELVNASADRIIYVRDVSVMLDETGSFSGVSLVATDDEDNSPSGWSWTVSFALDNAKIDSFSFSVPEGSAQNLADIVPAGKSLGATVIRGAGVPLGGTTGQVLSKASNANDDTEWVDVSGITAPDLSELGDVDASAVADGDAPVWDAATSTWKTAPNNAVTTVNGKAGAVSLSAADVGAREATWTPAIADVSGLRSELDTVSATAEAASTVANSLAAEVDQKMEFAGPGGVRLWAARTSLPTSGQVEGDICPIFRGA